MRRLVSLGLLAAAGLAAEPAVALPIEGWTTSGRLGAFLSNTTTANGDQSRDPTVAGAQSSTSTLGTADVKLIWTAGLNAVEQNAKGRYGRVRTRQDGWSENEDELRYDGVYRRTIRTPHFIYLSWGAESVLSGYYPDELVRPPDNLRNPGDPLKIHVGGGYGQRFTDLIPEDALEWRLGARVEKDWGTRIREEDRGLITGAEAFLRYEGKPAAWHQDLRWFAQYEGLNRFNDPGHVTTLLTAGMTFQLAKHLNLDLALRAFYETRPRDAAGQTGYNLWSVKQDTLIGIVYAW